MLIKDEVYGSVEVNEKVLVELINSAPMQRLKGVFQHGLLPNTKTENTMNFSRYEHSVGVMLLLRRLGAPFAEQIAGLIHDASHTAFSHTVDWAFGDPRKSDYQDKNLEQYIKNSELGKIISRNGFDVHEISTAESSGKYGLLERPSPDLCGDRVDYTLREGLMRYREEVKLCLNSLKVYNGEIVFDSKAAAKAFGRMYLDFQIKNWAAPEHMLRYHLLGEALRYAASTGIITHDGMYGTDEEITAFLRKAGDAKLNVMLDRAGGPLEFSFSEDGEITVHGKTRYVDPKFLENGHLRRLSKTDPEYKKSMDDEISRMSKPIRLKLREESGDQSFAVKKSKIEGKGLFAARDFKEGEIVTRWHTSKQLTNAELNLLSDEAKRHVICYQGKNIVMGSPERYVNHSCSANTHADDFCDVANRNIKKGEEITANYSETMVPGDSMKCSCGSRNCRIIIKPI